MTKDKFDFVDLKDLRIGLFVDLNVGWLAHPFATSAFKISTEKQIAQLRALGVPRIRYVPSLTDSPTTSIVGVEDQTPTSVASTAANDSAQDKRAAALQAQKDSQKQCEQRFADSVVAYSKMLGLLDTHPQTAIDQGKHMVTGLVGELLASPEATIRLLNSVGGDKTTVHPVNVTVLSLLLGRALNLSPAALADLGLAALLHDLGKLKLPERVRQTDVGLSPTELRMYQSHVEMGSEWARTLGLNVTVVQAIAQHHEMADGSGYPAQLTQERLTPLAHILALTNRYDGLCNPARQSAALTPHEALSLLFAQQKAGFEPRVLAAFIRMMGVYPPGSVVQLIDDRYAMVVSVNSTRPLKPRVVVHDPDIARNEALLLDLDTVPHMGIRRSFKPSVLPSATQEYLSPRPRACYYWEAGKGAEGEAPRKAA